MTVSDREYLIAGCLVVGGYVLAMATFVAVLAWSI